MTKKQRQSRINKLCRYILREQGRGFAMAPYIASGIAPGRDVYFDGISRPAPSCGTVACIVGTSRILFALARSSPTEDLSYLGSISDDLGLSDDRSYKLVHVNRWPKSFQRRFNKAKTPLGKARAAVALLKKVAKTDGKCLN